MPQNEEWSWLKFIKGPFVGKNWAKALVLTTIQLVIIAVIGAVIFTALTFFKKPNQNQKTDTRIAGNVGALNTSDNHSTTSETHYHFPLSDLFSFGSKDKKVNG